MELGELPNPETLKEFIKNGGDLSSREGIDLLEKYETGQIRKLAEKNRKIIPELNKARNKSSDPLFRRKIMSAMMPAT